MLFTTKQLHAHIKVYILYILLAQTHTKQHTGQPVQQEYF